MLRPARAILRYEGLYKNAKIDTQEPVNSQGLIFTFV